MNTKDPIEIMREIAALNPWEIAATHNWALVTQASAEPFIVSVQDERDCKGVVKGRFLFFPGLQVFREFVVSHQIKDFGVAMSPLDFAHFEAVELKNGDFEFLRYEPGFVPMSCNQEDRLLLAQLLNECYGFLLRLDEDAELPFKYIKDGAMFARKEVVDNVWVDGPFRLHDEQTIQQTETIELNKADCKKAKALPVFPKEIWELDFSLIPSYHTREKRPRFLYMLSAVNKENGERMVWERMSVDGKEGGLQRLWEGHAQRVLNSIIKWGRVPGEIHLRSGRVMRFIRPLGLQLPFKLVQHSKLPALEAEMKKAIVSKRV